MINFLRVEKPRRASQMSECFGAGTGCGWCRTYLTKLFEASLLEASQRSEITTDDLPDKTEYAAGRTQYVKAGGGTPPPGATPIDDK